MNNVLEEVSLLTTIPEKTVEKFMQKFIYCMCEDLKEDILSGKSISDLDIGIGRIMIKYDENGIKYKFIPSQLFESNVITTLTTKENVMENFLNEALIKKFMDAYKDLC